MKQVEQLKPEDYKGEFNINAMEKRFLLEALRRGENSYTIAGYLLEVTTRTVHRMVLKHGINVKNNKRNQLVLKYFIYLQKTIL